MKIEKCKLQNDEVIRPNFPNLQFAIFILQFAIVFAGPCFTPWAEKTRGDEPIPAKGGFHGLLEHETRRTLKAVVEYLAAHPQADDAETAAEWLFTTAMQQGLETDVLSTAEKFAQRTGTDSTLQGVARQVLTLGLARSGKIEAAVEQFSLQLLGARRQQPARILPFAHALATQARLQGDVAASRQVYEKLQAAFPLNAQVSTVVAARLARMQLIGQAAPRIDADDVDGRRISLTAPEYAGKVVLIDFWATNCTPCLEELPKLQHLYKQLHPQGFEIIGVSFDERAELVTDFRDRRKISWRQVLAPPADPLDDNAGTAGSEIPKRFGVTLIPALVVIDRDGKVAQVDVHDNELRETIVKLLARKPGGK